MEDPVKKRVGALLAANDLSAIEQLAVEHRRVLSYLTALTYDRDPVAARRAVVALGAAAGAVSDADPEFVRGHLRRLFWLLNDESGGIGWHAAEAIGEIIRARPTRYADFIPNLVWLLNDESGGIGWHAAEAIGEIIRARPTRYADFIPNLVWLLDMEAEDAVRFRGSILRGIRRVAEVCDLSARGDLTGPLKPLLEDADPELRELAAQCLGPIAGNAAPASSAQA